MAAIVERPAVSGISLLVPALLLVALTGALSLQAGLVGPSTTKAALANPETVTIPPRTFAYRDHGEFRQGGHDIDAPLVTIDRTAPLAVMKYQVTVGEYARCVTDGACLPATLPTASRDDVPVTGTSYDDARAYADWLSARTGSIWTLPSDEDLAFAAGKEFPDDALGLANDPDNPAIRWLADYKREAARKASRDPLPQPRGRYGENEFGLSDFGGNVWEWTATCQRRVSLDLDGNIARQTKTCGIYIATGKHRSPMSFFIRDPKGGGCSVGTPPDNLGFRLVRDDGWLSRIAWKLRQKGLDFMA